MAESTWAEGLLPDEPNWVHELIEEELEKRERIIAVLRSEKLDGTAEQWPRWVSELQDKVAGLEAKLLETQNFRDAAVDELNSCKIQDIRYSKACVTVLEKEILDYKTQRKILCTECRSTIGIDKKGLIEIVPKE